MKALRDRLTSQGVHSLLVQFTDIHGTARGKLVPLAHLDDVIVTGAGFSGPSIWGTGLARTGKHSEYFARGVPSTAQALPWLPGVARIVGEGFRGRRAVRGLPAPGAGAAGRAPGQEELVAAGRHRARVLPAEA